MRHPYLKIILLSLLIVNCQSVKMVMVPLHTTLRNDKYFVVKEDTVEGQYRMNTNYELLKLKRIWYRENRK